MDKIEEALAGGEERSGRQLNDAQRRALDRFEAITGWQPVAVDEFMAGECDFATVWRRNVMLLEMAAADVQNTDLRGTGADI